MIFVDNEESLREFQKLNIASANQNFEFQG